MRIATNVSFCLALSGLLASTLPAAGDDPPHVQAEVSEVVSVNWPQEVAQSITAGSAEGFSARLKSLSQSEIAVVASSFNEVYWDQPKAAFAWLTSLIGALNNTGDHARAAMFLDPVDIADDIGDMERGVYERWITQGAGGMEALLEQWSEREEQADGAISIVASLYQGEHENRFGEYMAWIDRSPAEFKGVLTRNVIPYLKRQHFDAAENLIVAHLEHESFAPALYQLVERRAEEDAEATLDRVAKIPVDVLQLGVKMEAFGLVLRAIAHEDLDAAEALLKQPSFVPHYFPTERVRMISPTGGWSRLAHWFHDESWSHFIDVALESDPKRAEEASKLMLDPQKLEDYRYFFLRNK